MSDNKTAEAPGAATQAKAPETKPADAKAPETAAAKPKAPTKPRDDARAPARAAADRAGDRDEPDQPGEGSRSVGSGELTPAAGTPPADAPRAPVVSRDVASAAHPAFNDKAVEQEARAVANMTTPTSANATAPAPRPESRKEAEARKDVIDEVSHRIDTLRILEKQGRSTIHDRRDKASLEQFRDKLTLNPDATYDAAKLAKVLSGSGRSPNLPDAEADTSPEAI